MSLTREEVIKLMLKDSNPEDVEHFISGDGVEVYVTGKPDIKKLVRLLYNIVK